MRIRIQLISRLRSCLASQQGSSLILVMVSVAVLGIVVMGITTINRNMSVAERFTRHTNEEDGMVAILRTQISDSTLCRQTLAFATDSSGANVGGRPGAAITSALGQGMVMCIPPDGVLDPLTPFSLRNDICRLSGAQRPGATDFTSGFWFPQTAISVGASYSPTPKPYNSTALAATHVLYSQKRPPLNIDISEIRFKKNSELPINATMKSYTGELRALIQSNEDGARQKNWHILSSVFKVTVDTSVSGADENPIVSCSDASSPEIICKDMGCSWDDTRMPKCTCGFAAASCGAGLALKGVNSSGGLICGAVALVTTCPAGQIAVGYNDSGLICEPPGQWLVTAWSLCIGGTRTRIVNCIHSMSGGDLDESFCPSPKPVLSKSC